MFNIHKRKRLLSLMISATMIISPLTVNCVKADDDAGITDEITTLQVLASADTHGRFVPYDYAVNAENKSGSLAQISTKVKELKAENPNTIIVDAGDTIQDNSQTLFLDGSPNPMIVAMNEIGYDTWSLGNHEFNYGIDTLKNVMKQSKATPLCGNVYDKDGKRLADPYKIVEKSGIKVGIIGMVTPNITRWDAANLEGYKVTNPIEETKEAIKELKAKGVDTIIAVDHMSELEEYEKIGSGAIDILDECPEIDAFVTAHIHYTIAGDYYYNKKVYSEYKGNYTASDNKSKINITKEDYDNAKKNGVVIVEPGKWAQNLSQINLDFKKNSDGKFELINTSSKNFSMRDVEADKDLIEKLQPYNDKAIKDAETPIGKLVGGDLVPENEVKGIDQAKLQPTAMIDLINSVQMYYGEKISGHKIDVASAAAFKDGANILEGTIKKCDTANIYKFDNTLYVLKISGKKLKEYMEWSASFYNTYKDGDLTISFNRNTPGYNYDMFKGVDYKIDISKEPGNRIVDLTKSDGSAIKDSDYLYLACNNYRAQSQVASGNIFNDKDDLPVVVAKSESIDEKMNLNLGEGRIRDLIASYIKDVKGGTIKPEYDNNWSIMGNNWNPIERKEAVSAINDGKISLEKYNSKSVTWDEVKKLLNSDGNKVLDVITFNDFHGNVVNSGKNAGMSKFANAVKEYKEANPNTIVVSGGDNYQGSAMSNLTYGKPVSAMMKEMGVVASAVGNHEFDWGTDKIAQWAKDGNFDYLASNIYVKATGKPVDYAKPYKIVEMDGVKVGFVGLTTPETAYKTKPENVSGIEFKDPIECGEFWAKKLKSGELPEGKADIVIALTHLGSAQEGYGSDISKEVTGEAADLCSAKDIDAVVSSHTHKSVAGYVNGKPVIQAYYAGRTLGDLKIVLDKDNNLVSITPILDNLYERQETLRDDPTVKAIYDEYTKELQPILDEVVGVTDIELSHDRFGYEGTSPLGKWVCDVMRKTAKTQIAVTNGGGLREPIHKGNITMGMLYTVMPFDNTLVTMDMTGAQLRVLLENAIMNTNIGWGQVSGVTVYYDKTKEAGKRITSMILEDGTRVEDNKIYSVVTNDFMAQGGDQYDFTGATNIKDTNIPIRDALVDSLKALGGKHLSFEFKQTLVSGEAPKQEQKPNDTNITTKPTISNDSNLPKTGSKIPMIPVAIAMVCIGIVSLVEKKKKVA